MAGTLYVVATPIGNLADLSARAREVLGSVAAICAEDTRHTRQLLAAFGLERPLLALHEHNEAEQAWKWVDEVSEAWAESGLKPDEYVAGTWGPDSADMLMMRTGRDWNTTDV